MSGILLFSPLTIRGIELRNRIVVPPMHQYSAVKGFPTDWHLMNAGKFAAGGAGLVVVESTKVERRGCGTVGDLGIWDDGFVEPLKRLVRFIKQQNAVAGIQLGHSGRKARAARPWEGDGPLRPTPEIDDWDAWQPVAPSAIAHSEKWPVPKALERSEVKDLVQAWGDAARRADEAGFDVLELHGAHAISCISSCPNGPTSAPMNMAARTPTGCASSPKSPRPCAGTGPTTSRCSFGCRWRIAPAGGRNKARGWRKFSKAGVSISSTVPPAVSPNWRRSWGGKLGTAIRCRCPNMSVAMPTS